MKAFILSTFGIFSISTLAEGQSPDIIYIFTDQQTAKAMSCADNPSLHTPNMDRIKENGLIFTRAYCSFPLCSPSRASMLTGKMPHELGISGNHVSIEDKDWDQSLGRLLSDAGYDCVYGGKWHLSEISLPVNNKAGFRRICGYNDNQLADSCSKYLDERDKSKPLFLVASFDNPHNICEWARNEVLPWGRVMDDFNSYDYPNLPSNYPIPPFEPDVIRKIQSIHKRVYPVTDYSENDWRQYRNAYFRLVEKVDVEIGKILDALERNNMMENSLIIFSSDHGDGNGAHQWNQKSIMYEECINVPFIVSAPGKKALKNSVNNEHLVNNGLDLLPTICDYAGAEIPPMLKGLSLKPILEAEPNAEWRDTLFVESNISNPHTSIRAAITSEYKYVVYSWGKNREQLFNLNDDPGEMTNLAVEQRHMPILNTFRKTIFHWSERTGYYYFDHYAHPGQTIAPGFEYKN